MTFNLNFFDHRGVYFGLHGDPECCEIEFEQTHNAATVIAVRELSALSVCSVGGTRLILSGENGETIDFSFENEETLSVSCSLRDLKWTSLFPFVYIADVKKLLSEAAK